MGERSSFKHEAAAETEIEGLLGEMIPGSY